MVHFQIARTLCLLHQATFLTFFILLPSWSKQRQWPTHRAWLESCSCVRVRDMGTCALAYRKTKQFLPSVQHSRLKRVWKKRRKRSGGKWDKRQSSQPRCRPHLREDWEGSTCTASNLPEARKIAPRAVETAFPTAQRHWGTDLPFLIRFFESLKKNENRFLSPVTTTECFTQSTCPLRVRRWLQVVREKENSICASFPQSRCLWRDARNPQLVFVNIGDVLRRMGLIHWSWLCLLEIHKTKVPASTPCPSPSCTICLWQYIPGTPPRLVNNCPENRFSLTLPLL